MGIALLCSPSPITLFTGRRSEIIFLYKYFLLKQTVASVYLFADSVDSTSEEFAVFFKLQSNG